MTTNDTSSTSPDPRHVFVGVPELMARYGRKKTTICALVNQPDFPGQVAPRRWRLDHVMAYEEQAAGRRTTKKATADREEHEPAAELIDDPDDEVLAPRRPRRRAT